MKKHLRILGIRGLPANHGGFETFAEQLALYLVEHGWEVTVYCQEGPVADAMYEDTWRGIRLVHFPITQLGSSGSIIFDWKSTRHACKEPGLVLTLGYNTAVFCGWYRLHGLTNIINMDGIEWRRKKWGKAARAWFYLNERAGVWLGNHLVADHPEIKQHLATRIRADKITTIAYGAPSVATGEDDILADYGLTPHRYAIMVARPEPENSVMEVVRAWSRKRRGLPLLVLGHYAADNVYQRQVMEAASDEVIFAGAVYDKRILSALRYYCRLYIHGHQVGGTNPSLVEALGAGNAVLAHDNRFNRWVAGEEGAAYFSDEDSLDQRLQTALYDDVALLRGQRASRKRHLEMFTWERVLGEYETLLLKHLPEEARVPATVVATAPVAHHAPSPVRTNVNRRFH